MLVKFNMILLFLNIKSNFFSLEIRLFFNDWKSIIKVNHKKSIKIPPFLRLIITKYFKKKYNAPSFILQIKSIPSSTNLSISQYYITFKKLNPKRFLKVLMWIGDNKRKKKCKILKVN